MRFKMSARGWLTVITVILLAVLIKFAWPEIVKAWHLLGSINPWVLALLLPVQLFSYYAAGGMIFNYLRSKGDLKDMSHWKMARLTFELNFVNHILPSGGAAGFSYLSWILAKHGVSVARSTMSQIVRFALTFISFVMIITIAVVFLALDHKIDRVILLISAALVVACVGAITVAIVIIGNKQRLERFSKWLTRVANQFLSFFTRGRKKDAVKLKTILGFFNELHQDFLEIKADRRILIKPFLWAICANLSDVALIWIVFWALGSIVNPAILFVAFGVASISSVISVAPGGAGVYEAVMIAFLASSGVSATVAIAGTLVARVTLVMGTILFGYVFYQLTILKYGKVTLKR